MKINYKKDKIFKKNFIGINNNTLDSYLSRKNNKHHNLQDFKIKI